MIGLDFGDISGSEKTMQRTWDELRRDLSIGKLKAEDTNSALQYTFLNVFNDIFVVNNEQRYCKRWLEEFEERGEKFFRCARVSEEWVPTYDRFIPKKEFITEDNRFSPSGVEWLYLAWSNNPENAKECAKAECRIKPGEKIAFCEFTASNKKAQIFDLTIADQHTYETINSIVKEFVLDVARNSIDRYNTTGKLPSREELNKPTLEMSRSWAVFTYIRMLSWQLFVPVENNKKYMYSPFHCFAYYLKTLGYDGIAYSSTVSSKGRNIVLFNKLYAEPIGKIFMV